MRKQLPNKPKTEKYKAHKLFKKSQIVTKKVKVQKKDPKVGRPAKQKKGEKKGAKNSEKEIVKEIVHKIPVGEKKKKVSRKRKGEISKWNGKERNYTKIHTLQNYSNWNKSNCLANALLTRMLCDYH